LLNPEDELKEVYEELFDALDVSSFEEALEKIDELKKAALTLEEIEECIDSNKDNSSEALEVLENLYKAKNNALKVVKKVLDAVDDLGHELNEFVYEND
jgi:DNA-binding transcriptional MerR regulator